MSMKLSTLMEVALACIVMIEVASAGGDVSECGNLSSAGVWTLTNNVSSNATCFTVEASDLKIDCAGFEIRYGNATQGYGINNTEGYSNLTVRGCQIVLGNASVANSYSILLEGTENSTIENNVITVGGTYNAGVFSEGGLGNNNRITNNSITITGSTGHGVYLDEGNFTIIANNTISTNGEKALGIAIIDASYALIQNNTIAVLYDEGILESDTMGIYLYGGGYHAVRENNVISRNVGLGIRSVTNCVFTQGVINVTAGDGIAYVLYDIGTTNNFTGTLREKSNIILDDASQFVYQNDTTYPGVWLRLNSSVVDGFNLTMLRWNNVSMIVNVSGPAQTINFHVEGVPESRSYNVWNGTKNVTSPVSTANGDLEFSVDLTPEGNKITVNVNTSVFIALSSPTLATYANSRSLNFTFTPSNDLWIQNCSLWTNETGTWRIAQNDTGITANVFAGINYTFTADGAVTWNVQCYDTEILPHSSFATANRTLVIDTIAPQLTFTHPTAVNAYNVSTQNFVTINYSTPEINFHNVTFDLYNRTGLVITRTNTSVMTYVNFTGLFQNEIYYYNVTVWDKANNTNWSETRTITLTNVAPRLEVFLINITNISVGRFVRINVTARDNVTLPYSVTIMSNETGTLSRNYTYYIPPQGGSVNRSLDFNFTNCNVVNRFRVIVNDSLGNANVSREFAVRVLPFVENSTGSVTSCNIAGITTTLSEVNISATFEIFRRNATYFECSYACSNAKTVKAYNLTYNYSVDTTFVFCRVNFTADVGGTAILCEDSQAASRFPGKSGIPLGLATVAALYLVVRYGYVQVKKTTGW